MPKYLVHITQTVSAVLEVEADSPDAAASEAFEHDDMPGPITHQAFGSGATVSEAGDWETESVTTLDDVEVWPAPPLREIVRVEVPSVLSLGRTVLSAEQLVLRWAQKYALSHDYDGFHRIEGVPTHVDFIRPSSTPV